MAGLRKRRAHHAEEHLLVGLTAREDADVAQGRGRQQPPQEVKRLRLDGALPGRLGLLDARPALGRPLLHLDQRAGVDREQLVHRLGELRSQLVVAVKAVAAVRQRLVVGDVARGLLQVRGETAALQDLGEDVGDPLAGDVRAAHLCDRVVAVAEEDSLVEAGGSLALLALEGTAALRDLGGELLEEEAPNRPGVAGVAGEEGPLDRLGEVDQGEDGAVEIGEVGLEEPSLLVGEVLDRIAHAVPSY